MSTTSVIKARIPVDLKQEFERATAHHGLSVSHVLRQLMGQYVERERELAHRREETLEAIEDIETGRVVAGDKVMTWLAGWGMNDELEPPR
ncbi:MAG: hypothetical protein JRE40_08835 [Deltaproteobacteria bacterium]|nr:hypothetical protein [Deltaproteobacteria bacterium]